MKQLLKRLQHRLWLWLAGLVDMMHPGYLRAEVTVGRVQRFYELLHETRYDGLAQTQESAMQRPQGPVDSKQTAQAILEQQEQKVESKARELRLAFMKENRLTELTETVIDLRPWETAEDVPAHVLTRALAVFILAYTRHMKALVGTKSSTESQ